VENSSLVRGHVWVLVEEMVGVRRWLGVIPIALEVMVGEVCPQIRCGPL